MSKLYFITDHKRFEEKPFLKNVLKWHGVKYEKRSDNLWYLWLEKESTRGVDLTNEGTQLEIRTTILSNHSDYQLVNWIGEAIHEEFGGICKDEEDSILPLNNIIDLSKTDDAFSSDYKTTSVIAKELHDVTIFGPYRSVHIGKNFIRRLETFGKEAAEQLELWIKHIQYKLPPASGNYLQIDHPEGPKTIKVLSLVERQIIEHFDYLAIQLTTQDLCLITNDDLNKILPDKWELLDEYTIDAAPLNDREIGELITAAIPLNKMHEMNE